MRRDKCLLAPRYTGDALQHTAPHCNTLHHAATHCTTLQHTATHCHTLQHTATHCNTLQHTATQEARGLECTTEVLQSVHGSSLVNLGETQVLATVALGA